MINLFQQGEHKIVLGDSLRDDNEQTHSHISIKYNWTPNSGFDTASGTIAAQDSDISIIQKDGTNDFGYSGWRSEHPDREQLALFWDTEKSAFVLEKVQASYEVNIESGTNITSDTIKRHARLEKPAHEQAGDNANAPLKADASNPFDFRHFLEEAKQTAASNGSGKTPVPGARTPLNGTSSPSLGAHRFRSPQLEATQITDGIPSRKTGGSGRRTQKASKPPSRTKPAVTAKPKASSQALSSEKVIDSDSSDEDNHVQDSSKPPKGHHRNTSNISISVTEHNDDNNNDGLQIVGESPPRSVPKKGYKIDRNAFRSTQGTPKLGSSSARPGQTSQDTVMHDADDASDAELERILEGNDNDDVDDMSLDKPPEPVRPSLKELKAARRRQSIAAKKQRVKEPTPPPALKQSDSIDEDEIARELEDALEEEFKNNDAGDGLGISQQAGDDESDISEEE